MMTSIFRHVSNSESDCFTWLANLDNVVLHSYFAGIRWFQTKDCSCQLCSSCAYQTGKAHNLTGTNGKIDIRHAVCAAGDASRLKHYRSWLDCAFRKNS